MRRRRRGIALAGAAGVMAATMVAAPAQAATCPEDTTCSTTVTFTVTPVGMTITVPDDALNIDSVAPGGQVSGQLGLVSVSDQRAALNASWTASVIATDFTTGGGTGPETIANINVLYWSGEAVSTSGSGAFVPGQPGPGDAVIINVPRTAFSHVGGSAINSASWNPTLVVHVPADAVAGTYTGTVSHSVT
jgi:hypothetical protein